MISKANIGKRVNHGQGVWGDEGREERENGTIRIWSVIGSKFVSWEARKSGHIRSCRVNLSSEFKSKGRGRHFPEVLCSGQARKEGCLHKIAA